MHMQLVVQMARMATKRTSAVTTATMATAVAASSTAASGALPPRRSARLLKTSSSSTTASDVPAEPRRRALSTAVSSGVNDDDVVPAKRKRQQLPVVVAAAPAGAADVVFTDADASNEPKTVLFKHGTLSRSYEQAKVVSGYKMVVGVDEAGRGPLAGPVVAAACHVPLDVVIEGVHDSKKLNEEQREALYDLLVAHPRIQWAVHVNSAQRIDEINILQASLESMVKAAEALPEAPDFVFVDGNRMPPTIPWAAEAVVKGDSKVYSIAAASIIAKVTRDRLMVEYDAQFPQYNLKQHKGYPTKDHMAAIAKHGPCAIHRMTFAPLKPKEIKSKGKAKDKSAKI